MIKDTLSPTKVDSVKLLIEIIPKFVIQRKLITIDSLKKNIEMIQNTLTFLNIIRPKIESMYPARQQLILHCLTYYRDLRNNLFVTCSFCTQCQKIYVMMLVEFTHPCGRVHSNSYHDKEYNKITADRIVSQVLFFTYCEDSICYFIFGNGKVH